jgi:copper transport protein
VVGTASSTGGAVPTTPSPPPLAVVGRWLFYWGLAVLVGGAAAGLLWSRGGLPGGGRLLLLIAWGVAAAGLVAMLVAERSLIGVSFGSFFRSGAGRGFVERAVALTVVGLVVGNGVAVLNRVAVIVLASSVAAAMLIHARAGHASVVGWPSWFNVGVQWVHLLAVGVWVGGLPWLLLSLRETCGEARGRVVKAYSTVAGIALAVVVLTGLSRLLDDVGWPQHWGRLFDTSFGLALVVKIGLIGALVLLGARNRYTNVPRAGEPQGARSLGRTVGVELSVVALVLAATAVMTELPPSATLAASASGRRPPAGVVVSGSDFATTVRVRLSVTPGSVGPNRFEVRVVDYDSGRPVPARGVGLTFSLPGRPDLGTRRLDLASAGPGVWAGRGTMLSMDGRWSLIVLVQESGGGVEVPLAVQTRLPPEKITVSRAPGQPTLFTIELSGGGSLQTYVDPGKAGTTNQVHFTFFTAAGDEQPIADARAASTAPSGASRPLPLRRLDTGHFVANEPLSAGRWRFQIQASTAGGQTFVAYLDQEIEP